MCGICGKLAYKNIIPSRNLISAMCKEIAYRGPNDEGVYTAPHIGLGQRRLTVIDLDPAACPPLSNEDKTIWLVFNGEIYNFRELRQELIERGHQLRTKSDSEVVLHLYEDEGFECLQKLNGMFAFALWDSSRKILFCARDRMGKKPLCYVNTGESFIFGSEIKAITIDPSVSVTPDYHAIDQYLTYQFVPSPSTAFKGIKRLGSGEYLTCDLNGNIKTQKYWEPPISRRANKSADELEEELIQRLQNSVELRMVSDVPVGAFLSGGIDSGAIVALMAQQSAKSIKTFSIGFEEEAYNELPYARLVAQRYGTEHHELIVKPDAAEVLPLLVKHYNEPFADSSALPTYYLSQMAKQHVTVALSGDGADELFAGYDAYAAVLAWKKWDALPHSMRRAIASTINPILDKLPYNNTAARIHRALAMFEASSVRDRRLQFVTTLKNEEKHILYTPFFRKLLDSSASLGDPLASYHWEKGMDDLDWLMRHDQNFYLPDCLMVKTDIASMANGLEVRSPFLDFNLVEFASTIPSELKRNSLGSKLILKRAIKDLLPKEVLMKPKTGFSIPISKWFRGDLAIYLREVLLSKKCVERGLFERRVLEKMINEHTHGIRDWSNRLWALLFLELWFQEFID